MAASSSSTPRNVRAGGDISGHIEAVRITRLLSPRSRKQPGGLSFAGKPVNKQGKARGVHVEFVDDDSKLPLPALDPQTHQVNLFFPKSEFTAVHALLTSRKDRLCYYWSSSDGANRRAWLVTATR